MFAVSILAARNACLNYLDEQMRLARRKQKLLKQLTDRSDHSQKIFCWYQATAGKTRL